MHDQDCRHPLDEGNASKITGIKRPLVLKVWNVASGHTAHYMLLFFLQISTLDGWTFILFYCIIKFAYFAFAKTRCQVNIYRANSPLVQINVSYSTLSPFKFCEKLNKQKLQPIGIR